jgi:anti-sigma factor (TIGR02949 family)
MDCRSARPLIELYLDGELDRTQASELEAHVDGCIGCQGVLNGLDEIRRALRDRTLRHAAPEVLRERIAAEARMHSPTARRPRGRRPPAWMRYAAACLLAFGAGGVSLQTWQQAHGTAARQQLARDLFASHWRALAATSPVDVVSSDRHTVKPWFAGRIAQSPTVRDFVAQGFPLVGGRLDYVGNERVAVLVYRHGKHLIDVFVLSASDALPPATNQQGYAVAPVMLDRQPAAIVTDMDRQELARFARLLGE